MGFRKSDRKVKSRVIVWVGSVLTLLLFLLTSCTWSIPFLDGNETGTGDETQGADASHIVDRSDEKYSYSDMESDIRELCDQYSQVLRSSVIGQSRDGKNLYVLTLGNPDAPDSFLITAGIHGREYITTQLTMAALEDWLTHQNDVVPGSGGETYATLMQKVRFEIVPMVNPDGAMLSQEGLSSLRSEELKATIREIYESDKSYGITSLEIEDYLDYWKANACGVDLNRNYDADWNSYHGMYLPCMSNYKGPSAGSEPETVAMCDLMDSLNGLRGVLCLHTQGQIIYWNCAPEQSMPKLSGWAHRISKTTGFLLSDDAKRDASLSDYSVLSLGIPAITVEVGEGLSPIPHEQFQGIFDTIRNLWTDSILFLLS